MSLRNGCFATIKSAENKGNYTNVRITISIKDKKRDAYYCAFSGWAVCIAKAHTQCPQPEQRIKITDFAVTNGYLDASGQQKWNNNPKIVIYDYDLQDGVKNTSANGGYTPTAYGGDPMAFVPLDTYGDSDLPF
jgi:hypothetical protein